LTILLALTEMVLDAGFVVAVGLLASEEAFGLLGFLGALEGAVACSVAVIVGWGRWPRRHRCHCLRCR
jgi:hypothetical protein